MLFNRVHVHSTVIALEFFHLSKFYLDEKTPLLKQFFSYYNCRLLNNNGLMHKYLLCWPGRQRFREKYFAAKGVRSGKSLGTAVLVGSNHIATATAEFANISAWATKNKLHLNQLRTRELVITRRRQKSNIKPEGPVIPGAEQVSTLRVLGVVLQSNLSMGSHIDHILTRCALSTHALRILRSHGLGSHKLHEVARMTSLAMLLYASTSWWGFISDPRLRAA